MFTSPRHCSLMWGKNLAVLIFKLKNPFSQHEIRIREASCMFLCITSQTLYEYNTFGVIGVGNDPWKLLFSCQLHWAHINFHFGKMTAWYIYISSPLLSSWCSWSDRRCFGAPATVAQAARLSHEIGDQDDFHKNVLDSRSERGVMCFFAAVAAYALCAATERC